MTREEALNSIKANVGNENLIEHMLATEAIMRVLAKFLGEDEEEWGLTGLLHDIDMELTQEDMDTHSKLGADLAREMGASETMTHAILCHNPTHGIPLQTKLDKALFCADPLANLIVALAKDRKLASLKAETVIKKFKQEDFTIETARQQISQCSGIGIKFNKFIELGLKAMQSITADPDL